MSSFHHISATFACQTTSPELGVVQDPRVALRGNAVVVHLFSKPSVTCSVSGSCVDRLNPNLDLCLKAARLSPDGPVS